MYSSPAFISKSKFYLLTNSNLKAALLFVCWVMFTDQETLLIYLITGTCFPVTLNTKIYWSADF